MVSHFDSWRVNRISISIGGVVDVISCGNTGDTANARLVWRRSEYGDEITLVDASSRGKFRITRKVLYSWGSPGRTPPEVLVSRDKKSIRMEWIWRGHRIEASKTRYNGHEDSITRDHSIFWTAKEVMSLEMKFDKFSSIFECKVPFCPKIGRIRDTSMDNIRPGPTLNTDFLNERWIIVRGMLEMVWILLQRFRS
jgi:hypothetical protein